MKIANAIDEDTDVIRAVQAGDVEAYRLLVDRHKGRLLSVVLKLVADPLVAEEIAQDAFVKAYLNLSGFRGDARFGTWLVQIGIHAARDHLRKVKRLRERGIMSLEDLRTRQSLSADPVDRRPAVDPQARLGAAEDRQMVQQALATLPPDYRVVLVLRHYEEWSYERIAGLTGDTVGTLKVRAHRARKLLRDKLSGIGWQPAVPDTECSSAPAESDEEMSS